MSSLLQRVVWSLCVCALVSLLASQFSNVATAGKKEEQKKEVTKEGGKKDDTKKDDKEKIDEPKKEPFKVDVALKVLKGHTNWVNALVYGAGGKHIATASRDRTVKIWDVEAGKDVYTLKPHPDNVKGVVFVEGESKVAASTGKWNKEKKFWEGEIKIWDVKAGKQTGSLKAHNETIEGLALSRDGKRLASCSEDQTVKIWDVAAGKETQTLKGHTDLVQAAVFSADGTRLATASADRTVRIWDTASGKELLTLTYKKELPKEVAPKNDKEKKNDKDAKDKKEVKDKKDVAKEKKNGKDKKDEKAKKDDKELTMPRPFTAVTFTADGKKVVAGNLDGIIKIWDIDSKKEIRELKAHEGVWAMALNPDGSRLATGGWDKTIKVWDTSTWKEMFTIKAHEGTVIALAFSPNGQQIASGGIDNVVRLWSATTPPPQQKD